MSVPSVTIAKDRLRNLLITDRIQCTPDMIEFLTSDLYQTISKYIEISPEQFDVKITRTDIHIKYTGENIEIIFTNLKQRYNIRDYKISLVFLVTLISLVGILMVRSARPDLMNRQIMGVCLGLIVMFIISFIDYKWILNLYWPLYALNIVMLLAVLVFGTKVNGARRWLNLGFTQFQPSDLTKILMILFFAKFLMEREQKIKEPKTIIQAIALILPSLALIYKQPNLSTTICIAALFAVLLYLGGLSYKLIGTVLVITIPTIIILLVVAIQPNQPFLKDYQQERILAWLEPEKYADDESYQQLNSVMAIGSDS